MDLITDMTGAPLLAVLTVLALVDSTSFGTLAIPVWLLLAPGRVRAGRIVLFLAVIAVFYLAVGLAVLAGAGWVLDNIAGLADLAGSRQAMVLALVLGIGLFLWSFRLDSPAAKERVRSGTGRLAAWRRRATGVDAGGGAGGGYGSLVGLALAAGLVEVGTMVPYLAAIGLIAAQEPGWPASGLWLAGYCVVMVLPALVLLAARLLARRVVDAPLRRLDAWFGRHGASTAAWVVGIIGVLLVVNSAPVVFG